VRWELAKLGVTEGLTILTADGWRRAMLWPETGRPWIAPSPNMPTFITAVVYPGMCLLEGTRVSEGRGTTRPFNVFGAPWLRPVELARKLQRHALPGVSFLPMYFRPQYQKHAGQICGGVEVVIGDVAAFPSFRAGIDVLAVLHELTSPNELWRTETYEFVGDRPAIDLLAGCDDLRRAVEEGTGSEPWVASWAADEAAFRAAREPWLLYR
jgi:uncharacterized protein YbbC (DUF1343 family)